MSHALDDAPKGTPDPQAEPVLIRSDQGRVLDGLMIEQVTWERGEAAVSGWLVGAGRLEWLSSGAPLTAARSALPRADVLQALDRADHDPEVGFTIKLSVRQPELTLRWWPASQASDRPPVDMPLRVTVQQGRSGRVRPKAHFEAAAIVPEAGCIVVAGWLLAQSPEDAWLETDDGQRLDLDQAFRSYRKDVFDALGTECAEGSPRPGFLLAAAVEGRPGTVRIMADAGQGAPVLVAEMGLQPQKRDPLAVFQWMNGLHTPQHRMAERLAQVEAPLFHRLLAHDRQTWPHLPVKQRVLGSVPAAPKVSVVIPLYGRADFVESQLVEFAKDPWLIEHAQLIYVLDDPRLVDNFQVQAEQWHRLYRVPFTWVWGAVNRGFSGANNLGRAQARADRLVFMNSDCFPRQPGWLPRLLQVLDDPGVGAVAPRLLFADGSIQHASMAFMRREELGIWVNHHPHMGLDPALDPRPGLCTVPAVTGACMAVRAADLDAVGGWDTGYLVGDFEDSDLCLNLRSRGLTIAYQPEVELTHLERQSFRLLGQGDFRTRIVILNAVRHQQRWAGLLAETSSDTI